MSKLHCLVSATATTFAVLANAQPFSSVVGSWGYGRYGAFHEAQTKRSGLATLTLTSCRRLVPSADP